MGLVGSGLPWIEYFEFFLQPKEKGVLPQCPASGSLLVGSVAVTQEHQNLVTEEAGMLA